MADSGITKASQAICDELSEEQNGMKRDVLSHVGNTWSLLSFMPWGLMDECDFQDCRNVYRN